MQLQMARFFEEHDVHYMVLEMLSIQELRVYGLVCERTYDVVKTYLQKNATTVRLLDAFIDKDNISAFRRMQRATGAVIGGSAALQFFTRREYTSSDLDVYVHATYAGKVICALKKIKCLKDPKRSPIANGGSTHPVYVGHSIKEVIDFTTPKNRKLQLIITRRRPVDVILTYHSSKCESQVKQRLSLLPLSAATVMNFLTGWYAYSLYGRETLQVGVAMYNPNATNLQTIKNKWEARGWVEVASQAEATERGVFPACARTVGDHQCCIVKLSTDGARGDAKYRDISVRESSWMTGFNSNGVPYFFVV